MRYECVKGRAFTAEVDPRAKPGAPAAVERRTPVSMNLFGHKRKRIIILFFMGIVLPSLLLGYLAFRGVKNDRALVEKNRL
ncbi:MAG: hypothetical protein Q8O91_01335, partial [Candidatus Aminicenantes bacterium]|nr:hypothetical protein [Candidatus Aminicenantes bacterium]